MSKPISVEFTGSILLEVENPEDQTQVEKALTEELENTDVFVNDVVSWGYLAEIDLGE